MRFKYLLHLCLLFCSDIFGNFALDPGDIVFVILSQDNPYHIELAENIKNDIQKEARRVGGTKVPVVHLSHIDFPMIGDWTILPLIPAVESLHSHDTSWIIFIEDVTEIRLEKLLTALSRYDENENVWLGYALHDEEATIIHHFAFYQDPISFKYPNAASGIAFSRKSLKSIADRLRSEPPSADFSIDKSHELSKYIWNEGKGPKLKHEASFCVVDGDHCATIPRGSLACDAAVPVDSIYFAVKTYSKFHSGRVAVVRKTWAKLTSKIEFFSDLEDPSIPTIDLGVPNTESGHCAKTMEILKYAAARLKKDVDIKWVVLADDDTIFSIPRLRKFLTCYDWTSAIAIGERYGYNVAATTDGYNYITGGGGIIFSRELVGILAQPRNCKCPSISTPDDMFLGICIGKLNATLIHSPYFHQARPVDYSPDYLRWQTLISFHKHWMIDPIRVYEEWLFEDETGDGNEGQGHIEL